MATNGMTINGLNPLSALTADDKIPVWDTGASGEPTKEITAQNFASSIKTLASLLGTGDVVNDLTSTATDKPLSAAQGKVLYDKLTYSGYMEWNNITLDSGSWKTNTGNVSSGVKPSGLTQQDAYNLLLDVAGTYLVIYHAEMDDSTNKTGLRGIRQYVSETNINEFFFAPGGNGTTCDVSCIVHSNGSDTAVRMGVYQSSGSSVTVKNIRIVAIMLLRD